ncbi:hypothetical protein NUM_06600 [Actinocatenispora comari]|uniref:Uncharacterized protein n=2 Tax=Actinocatenispora comari TaxID=2807577 RepID=A0A8J4EIW8_9ACTN|nr:hypothetical protein NUM_06600 [Actinocatenispora comari]
MTIDGVPYRELGHPLRAVGAHLDARSYHPRRSARAHLLGLARYAGISARRVDQVIELVGLESVARRRAGGFSLRIAARTSWFPRWQPWRSYARRTSTRPPISPRFTMLHHVPSVAQQDALFAEACRVLRPGGAFRGVDSDLSIGFRLLHLGDTMVVLDPATLPDRLRRAGFAVDTVAHRPRREISFTARRPPAS